MVKAIKGVLRHPTFQGLCNAEMGRRLSDHSHCGRHLRLYRRGSDCGDDREMAVWNFPFLVSGRAVYRLGDRLEAHVVAARYVSRLTLVVLGPRVYRKSYPLLPEVGPLGRAAKLEDRRPEKNQALAAAAPDRS